MRSNNQKLVNSRQNLNQFEADMRVDESLIAVKRELHCMKTIRVVKLLRSTKLNRNLGNYSPFGETIFVITIFIYQVCACMNCKVNMHVLRQNSLTRRNTWIFAKYIYMILQ